jgi:hypothetical protein
VLIWPAAGTVPEESATTASGSLKIGMTIE